MQFNCVFMCVRKTWAAKTDGSTSSSLCCENIEVEGVDFSALVCTPKPDHSDLGSDLPMQCMATNVCEYVCVRVCLFVPLPLNTYFVLVFPILAEEHNV